MSLVAAFRSLLKRLAGGMLPVACEQPLFNDIELQQIQRQARNTKENPFAIQRDVQHPLLGERTSSFSGSGYEFAEHRRYVAGDDPRFIDWRVMARTGKLQRKVFHEERRPQLMLVVDRRGPMRFGTRGQLKVSAAVSQAMQLAYQARQQQLTTACVILEEQAHWLPASQSSMGLHNIIQQLNRPCPPLSLLRDQCSMGNVLSELAVRLNTGCLIYLLSDFHDLDADNSSVLYHLARQHRLYAKQILDPIEQELPASAQFTLLDEQTGQILSVDSHDKDMAEQFARDMQQQRFAIEALFQNVGAEYQLLMTGEGRHG